MFAAVRRLLNILFWSMIGLLLVLFGLRSLGLKDQYQAPFDTKFYAEKNWIIIQTNGQKDNLDEALKSTSSNALIGADVQRLGDGNLVIWPNKFVSKDSKLKYLSSYDFAEWTAEFPQSTSLEAFTKATKERPIFLRAIHLNQYDVPKLLEALGSRTAPIVLQAGSQALKRKMKEKVPLWIFANTPSEMGRFKVFSALLIEPAVSLDADLFILDSSDSRIIQEGKRRKRKVLLIDREDGPKTEIQDVDGIVTTRPGLYLGSIDRK